MTYRDIMTGFKKSYPHIEIEDYRPANGLPNSIVVWSKDSVYLVYSDESFGYTFIIGQRERRK